MADSDSEDYGLFSAESEIGGEPDLGPDVADVRHSASKTPEVPGRGVAPDNAARPAPKSLYEKLKGEKMPRLFAAPSDQEANPGSVKGAEAREPGYGTEDLKKAFQICLDDEANLAGLEDPDLVVHMERARSTYAENLISEKRCGPDPAALKATHKQVLVDINSLLRAVEEQKAERQRNTDEICVHSSNAKRLSVGAVAHVPPPHGYPVLKAPVAPECLEAFKRLGAQIAEDGDMSQKSVAFCEDTLKRLTLLRRSIEGLLDGLWRLAESPKPLV